MEIVHFENNYYASVWVEFIPGTDEKIRFRDGSYVLQDDGDKAVYDGGGNYMGTVLKDGTFQSNNDKEKPSAYEMTFLLAAMYHE